MDSISASTIVIVLLGVLVAIFVLVVILYKPPRQLIVHSKFKSDNSNNGSILEVEIENAGKTREKITYPYLKFSTGFHTKKYQVGKQYVTCRYPRILKRGEKMVCEIDISPYKKLMEKDNFVATHLNVIVDDMVGMEFKSETLEV